MSAMTRGEATLAGFGNQLRREAASWWATPRWWRQAAVWTAVLAGLLVLMLWVVPGIEGVAEAGPSTVPELAGQFARMAAVITAAGIVLSTQGILIDEQRSGTLEWLLSKPLARPALLLAKLVGHASGLLAVAVAVPWVVAYALLSVAAGDPWPVAATLGAVALIALLVVFHLALVLLLSVVARNRVAVLAVPLALLVSADLVMTLAPGTADALPWALGSAAGAVLAVGAAPRRGRCWPRSAGRRWRSWRPCGGSPARSTEARPRRRPPLGRLSAQEGRRARTSASSAMAVPPSVATSRSTRSARLTSSPVSHPAMAAGSHSTSG